MIAMAISMKKLLGVLTTVTIATVCVSIASVVTSKAAIRGHFKTGHSDWPKT